ncbi:MAG: DUF2330 domain-containing protein [Fibrella sp.]|nr:DUF2330 domain-containing protein [Armatimonadota bacterium]
MKRCLVIATGLALLSSAPVSACMPVSESPAPIAVAGEEAVIAYDSRTGTERFIRKATFDTRDRDFGFLVPTPSVPTVSESSNELFNRLGGLVQTPVIEKKTRFLWGRQETESTTSALSMKSGSAPRSFPQVEVQEIKRVGDFEAAVLKATDTNALMGWLKKYGYVSSPELKEWVEPYVRQGYAITAFRIAADVRDKHTPGVQMHLKPVCLTFQTPAPFYPYREGKNAVARDGRLLRVYYLGDKRVTGRLGDSLANASEEWGANTTQSRSVSPDDKVRLCAKTGLEPAQVGDRLTVFEDRASLRARKDLFFTAATDQALQVPTRIEYNDIDVSSAVLPIAGSLLAGTGLAWWVRRRRR